MLNSLCALIMLASVSGANPAASVNIETVSRHESSTQSQTQSFTVPGGGGSTQIALPGASHVDLENTGTWGLSVYIIWEDELGNIWTTWAGLISGGRTKTLTAPTSSPIIGLLISSPSGARGTGNITY